MFFNLLNVFKQCMLCTEMHEKMPARARQELYRQQHQSEIFITWLQIAAIVFFATLYLIAPDPGRRSDLAVQPVPLVLGIYAIFTVLRLGFAARGKLTTPFLVISVFADFIALYAIIWSFHLSYEQPPAFYLKAPTLLYVFILIAIRAMRFQPVWVVLAGVTASAGWLLMLGYALIFHPGNDPVTRDYVAYMTSNTILIGAEIDKLLSMLVVTGVLAIVLYKAYTIRSRAITSDIAFRDMSHFFDEDVARKIALSDRELQAGQAEIRDASIMFIDLRGFTKHSEELKAEEIIELLNEYQSLIVPIIRDHNGAIDKFLGDGILASFGAVEPSETHSKDALEAAHAVLQAGKEWDSRRQKMGAPVLGLGVGIATGAIIFGVIGHGSRLEYTVIGSTVNRAAKIEAHTKQEQLSALCDEKTYDTACVQGYEKELRVLRNVPVAGMGVPVDLAIIQ